MVTIISEKALLVEMLKNLGFGSDTKKVRKGGYPDDIEYSSLPLELFARESMRV